MTRTPGYDIDGQPTKVDPRDYADHVVITEAGYKAVMEARNRLAQPDPDPLRPLENDPEYWRAVDQVLTLGHKPRRSRPWGCLLAVLACAAFWAAVYWLVTG